MFSLTYYEVKKDTVKSDLFKKTKETKKTWCISISIRVDNPYKMLTPCQAAL